MLSSSGGGGGGGLSRSVSRSTELLHVNRQDLTIGRRSWDSLVPDKKKSLESPSTSGPDGVTDERTRFSGCASPTVLGNNSPWFGGASEFRGCDTPTRLLLGGTIPRSILALSDRPVTYEEELEERLGLLRVSARTLYQRLASEKKRGKELSQQLSAREINYREVVEKMRSQYDQRFERLKNRARLLVTRCELLRSEKQQLEMRLGQAMQNAVKERQTMEGRISNLEDEIERLRSEKQEQELPVLKVVEDADIEEERKAEEGKRKAKEEEPRMKKQEEKAEEDFSPTVEEGEKRASEEDEQEEGKEDENKIKADEEEEEDAKENKRARNRENGSANDHYRILCEIAVARVAWLEDMLRSSAPVTGAKSPSANNHIRAEPPPSSLTRRSSSCPMLGDDGSRLPSNEGDVLSPTGPDPLSILRPKRDFQREEPGLTGSDREGVIRFKANTIATMTRPLSTSHSMPPTIGHPKPVRPSSTTMIRHSLQKLFASGRPNFYDPTFATTMSLIQGGKQPRVKTRIETPSDDELPLDTLHLDAKMKQSRRTPKNTKGGASFEAPAIKAKRTASLPRVELFRKFQTTAKQERDSSSLIWYQDNFQTTQAPLTKQERLLGVRLTPEKVSPTSGLMANVPDIPTSPTPLTKQERVLGVRLDRSGSDKASPTPGSVANIQDVSMNHVPLTKQERVLGVRLERLASDRVSSTSGFAADVPETNFSSRVNKESTESLPEKVKELEGEGRVSSVKRNRSVHSTFGRLHQRRNGITDIARIEPKTSKPPQSPLDQFGKNLKQYLH